MVVFLFFVSIFGGFLSGFLGLGGAVVMIPLMLTLPPLFGVGELSMKTVSGLSMVQVLFASMSGIIIHKRNNFVHTKTLFYVGIPMGLLSLSGSYLSKYMNNFMVMVTFEALIVIAFFMLFFDNRGQADDVNHELKDIHVGKIPSIIVGAMTGTLSGIVGAGGGFIMIPIMIKILKIPLKVTIGTSLGVVFIGALFGAIGKIISLQVDYRLVIPVVTGSLLAAQLGARVSKTTRSSIIRRVLLAVVIFSMLQVGFKLMKSIG